MINWIRIPVKIQFNNGRMADSIFNRCKARKTATPADVQTNDDKRRLYEKEKRPKRSFQPKWKESRDWLQYNDEKNKKVKMNKIIKLDTNKIVLKSFIDY